MYRAGYIPYHTLQKSTNCCNSEYELPAKYCWNAEEFATQWRLAHSVADPRCLSPIPDPGSWFLPIPDPESKNSNKREGWKKICCYTFFCSLKFHKIGNYFIFEMLKKKILANFQRIIEVFTPKIVTKFSKIWVWDTGSEIRKKTYSGSQIQGSKRHRIPDPQHRWHLHVKYGYLTHHLQFSDVHYFDNIKWRWLIFGYMCITYYIVSFCPNDPP